MDLSIFDKFHFNIEPIGIKFELLPPKGIERLDKKLALCEMFKEAQGAEQHFIPTLITIPAVEEWFV